MSILGLLLQTLVSPLIQLIVKFYYISYIAYNLLKSFLDECSQFVNINGLISQRKIVVVGGPQGSVLYLLLFLLYINDITHCLPHESDLFSYADNSLFYASGYNIKDLYRSLNKPLKYLSLQLKFNFIYFEHRENNVQAYFYNIKILFCHRKFL